MRVDIRPTTREDVPLILRFIHALAAYEELEHEVVADEQTLAATLFGDNPRAKYKKQSVA